MVETITPVVHGGSKSRWAILLALHAAGATVAAAAFGAALGVVGAVLGAPWGAAGLVLIAAVAGAYLVREAFGLPLPVPQLRRQVPDWWRTYFPFGPASFLYGLGLGVGFLTYLSHGTLVAISAAALASGRPLLGAGLLAPFGLVRGLTAAVAFGAATEEQSSALVASLARSAGWPGWRVAHATALLLVAVVAVGRVAAPAREDVGAAAAAVLAIAFGAAGVAKLLRPARWRRALASYRFPRPLERASAVGVPVAELAVATLPALGLRSSAGGAALAALAGFSAAIVAARIRVGRRLDCGCFGRTAVRDYRSLLLRNGGLGAVAAVAWRAGSDAPAVGSLGLPTGDELVPAILVVAGLALAGWAGVRVSALRRGGADR